MLIHYEYTMGLELTSVFGYISTRMWDMHTDVHMYIVRVASGTYTVVFQDVSSWDVWDY